MSLQEGLGQAFPAVVLALVKRSFPALGTTCGLSVLLGRDREERQTKQGQHSPKASIVLMASAALRTSSVCSPSVRGHSKAATALFW